jgi:branched-chain amino acid transport system permease protein
VSVFLEQIADGLALGSIYALLTLGFSMVYGVVQMTNFAHGDFYMVGVLLFTTITAGGSIPLPWAFVLIPAVSAVIALVVAVTVYRPLFGAPRLNLLITAIGMSIFLENFSMRVWGPDTRAFPTLWEGQTVGLGTVTISYLQIFSLFLTLALMASVLLFVRRTRAGVAMRAVAEDIPAARLMGINVNRIVYLTFVISGILGGFGGLIYALYFGAADPLMGFIPTLKAFAAAVVGGIGSIPGAIVGGFTLGLAESLSGRFISSGYQDAIAFFVLIVILLVRPQGIFGKKSVEKV